MTAIPEEIVFDAEPLLAHADDEPGCEVVAEYLDAVATAEATGYLSLVNHTEVRYTLARKYDRDTADEYLDWLADLGVEVVGVGDTWLEASEFVLEYNPALGDSFALATAADIGATLLVGGDDAGSSHVPVVRFRDGAA